MEFVHRYNSEDRQHYLLKRHYSFKLKPRLLYVGQLKKNGGWKENVHSHDFCEILFVSDGRGTIDIGGTLYEINRGDIVIYNAGTPHLEQSSVEEPMEFRFMALDGLEITDLPRNHFLPPGYRCVYPSGEYYDTFSEFFTRMITEFENEDEFYNEIAKNLARVVTMLVFRLVKEHEKNDAPLLQGNKNLDTALRYIHENFRRELTLEEIASKCFISKFYLSHLFTQTQNRSIGKYIQDLRLSEAMRLLGETSMSVSEIAEEVGFNDIGYFCRTFKKATSLTPLQYRKHRTPDSPWLSAKK